MREPWLEPADYRAKQKENEAKYLADAVKQLMLIQQTRLRRLTMTEKVVEAQNLLAQSIMCLMEEQSFLNRVAGQAELQSLGLMQSHVLTIQGEALPPLTE